MMMILLLCFYWLFVVLADLCVCLNDENEDVDDVMMMPLKR